MPDDGIFMKHYGNSAVYGLQWIARKRFAPASAFAGLFQSFMYIFRF